MKLKQNIQICGIFKHQSNSIDIYLFKVKTIETTKQWMKSVQSQQQKHQNDVSGVSMVHVKVKLMTSFWCLYF